MLMMVLLDAIIIIFVTYTMMHKLPVHFKVMVYKIPTWLLSLILDFILLLPAGGFAFGAVASLVAEPIIYPMLVIDKKHTLKYVQYSIEKFGKIVEPSQMREAKKKARAEAKAKKRSSGKKWYDIFIDD
jgi:hypothetical protein